MLLRRVMQVRKIGQIIDSSALVCMVSLNKSLTSLLLACATLCGCAQMSSYSQSDAGWTTLFDSGSNLNQWTLVGDANWRIQEGMLQADFLRGKVPSYLVTKSTYQNMEIRAEIWVDDQTNSGIFIRCQQADKISADTCYEINIWDTRPDPSYGTGAIVDVAKVSPMPRHRRHFGNIDNGAGAIRGIGTCIPDIDFVTGVCADLVRLLAANENAAVGLIVDPDLSPDFHILVGGLCHQVAGNLSAQKVCLQHALLNSPVGISHQRPLIEVAAAIKQRGPTCVTLTVRGHLRTAAERCASKQEGCQGLIK